MAIVTANSSLTRLGRCLFRLYAESDLVAQPTFYVWSDGIVLQRLLGRAKTGGGWYIEVDITVDSDGTTDISVFDSATDVPEDIWPGRFVFQWEREADADEYWVEEYVDSEWILRKPVQQEANVWVYSYKTRQLEDCATHTFRIRVKGANGMMSVARTFTVYCVRRPDHPDVTYTFEDEFLDALNWTSTGWTGSWAAGWAHTAGNTSALSQSHAAVIGVTYGVSVTITGRTAGSVTVGFGGDIHAEVTATTLYSVAASSVDSLVIKPTSNFNGTIVMAIEKTLILTVEAAA
jgi:hypothetical protein